MLTGCHATPSDDGANPGRQVRRPRPARSAARRRPSCRRLSGSRSNPGKPHVGCLYNDVDDPDSHWVAIAHERYRYRGHTLTGVASEIVTTMQLQGLGLITAFPEGGPQAFMFGSPPTSCQYWV